MPATHEVFNQVPPLVDYDVHAADPALAAGLTGLTGAGTAWDRLDLGAMAGSAEYLEVATQANTYPPRLRTHDATGHRIDEVEFHPAWHQLMRAAVSHGLHAAPWADSAAHPHLRRAAGFYTWTQAESGHLCPISMTYAAVPALRNEPGLAARYEQLLCTNDYDPGLRPPETKKGLLAGMSMTEKQGGSDVRSNTTSAVPDGDGYRLTGHKWFTSAPMNDLFLTLARTSSGPTCFLLPRVLPDGSRNTFQLQRLKDKLGNRANASAEIEYDGAWASRVGPEGRGIAVILSMVSMTRLDCVLGSAGQLRVALSQASWHALHRRAFGSTLIDQPAMTAVLADLAVESWAATLTAMFLADAVDRGRESLLRLALPVSKFWICKRAVPAIAEALECLGGNGYVEESMMPRLLRESPLNGLWEGSGNVAALDALRALRSPATGEALLAEIDRAAGSDPHLDRALTELKALLVCADPSSARRLASLAARLLGASLLVRQAPEQVAALYCITRLGQHGDRAFGELPSGYDPRSVVAAVTPQR